MHSWSLQNNLEKNLTKEVEDLSNEFKSNLKEIQEHGKICHAYYMHICVYIIIIKIKEVINMQVEDTWKELEEGNLWETGGRTGRENDATIFYLKLIN